MNAVKSAAGSLFRHLLLCSIALAVWISTASLAVAARMKEEAEAPPEKSYVMPYILVMFFIALGLIAVFRPSRRANEPTLKQEAD